jgi:NAD-dependent protein deacetylases, SIR2 family
MTNDIKTLHDWIKESNNIVFFGGAGVSTESGIPDFRSDTGLYSEVPEVMLSRSYYVSHTAEFYRFYKDKMIFPEVKPNKAHYALAELEKSGKLKAVVTQNIDGLHQMAGSTNVLELHGSVNRNYCRKCKKFYNLDYVINNGDPVPLCTCGGVIKPDVVLYEEPLDLSIYDKAVKYIADSDLFIVGGTSLAVQPAASLVLAYTGKRLVLINMSSTHYDKHADLIVKGKIGEVLGGY